MAKTPVDKSWAPWFRNFCLVMSILVLTTVGAMDFLRTPRTKADYYKACYCADSCQRSTCNDETGEDKERGEEIFVLCEDNTYKAGDFPKLGGWMALSALLTTFTLVLVGTSKNISSVCTCLCKWIRCCCRYNEEGTETPVKQKSRKYYGEACFWIFQFFGELVTFVGAWGALAYGSYLMSSIIETQLSATCGTYPVLNENDIWISGLVCMLAILIGGMNYYMEALTPEDEGFKVVLEDEERGVENIVPQEDGKSENKYTVGEKEQGNLYSFVFG